LKIGEPVGALSSEMAEKTGLARGIPVAAGGADAYIGVIGVNALQPGMLALITGSSQLQIGISDIELHARGLFGSFPDAILPGCYVVEAGQISTGSILNWFTTHFTNRETAGEAETRGCSVYDVLGEQAERIDPGSEGLLVLEHWQGNRTPWVDANSRGVIRGLTLKHTPAHVFRAIMEGVAYGTAVILERMEQERLRIEQIIACGGATKSDLWMQIMADVTGKRISIPEEQEAVSLGSAIAGMVAAGIYPDLRSAAHATVRTAKTVDPNLENTEYYKEYVRQYVATYENLAEESKKLVATIRSRNAGG
jgi:ribulose kinase